MGAATPAVIIRFQGGLGNTLFQYTAGRGLARRTKGRILAAGRPGSIEMLEQVLGRPLDRPTESVSYRIPAVLDSSRAGPGSTRLVRILATAARRTGRSHHLKQLPECAFDDRKRGDPVPTRRRPVLLDGYFQHSGYFLDEYMHVVDEIRPQLSIERRPETAVHLRRGDYVTLGHALDAGYYERVLVDVDQGRTRPVLVVSDDGLAAEALAVRIARLGFVSTARAAGLGFLEDIAALASCQNLIAANSSFSWWAAAIGDRVWSDCQRQVVVPDPWLESAPVNPAVPGWTTFAHAR